MKLVATFAIVILTMFTAHVVPAGADATCASKGTCKKKLSCASGYTLIDLTGGDFVCRKATDEVQSASLECKSGETMKYLNGTDVCKKQISVNPTCKTIVTEKYTWDASKKACKRNSGNDTWKTVNIKCGNTDTAYNDSTGKCEGTASRPVFSIYDADACDEILADSGWAQDFSGNKDMCVTSSTEYSWKAPALQ